MPKKEKELEFYENLDPEDYESDGDLPIPGQELELPHGPVIMRVKPCYNFQSIEFELDLDGFDELSILMLKNAYTLVLQALKEATDEVIPATSNPNNPDPPTEAQIKLLNKFGCKWTKSTTKAQAREMINAAIEAADKKKKK